MNVLAPTIKKRRLQMGFTQKDMAEKLHLSEKSWQNIENGITKLDIDRLIQISDVLETTLIDMINATEGIYVGSISNTHHNQVGFSKEVTINNDVTESERKLLEKVIKDKDIEITFLREYIKNNKA